MLEDEDDVRGLIDDHLAHDGNNNEDEEEEDDEDDDASYGEQQEEDEILAASGTKQSLRAVPGLEGTDRETQNLRNEP